MDEFFEIITRRRSQHALMVSQALCLLIKEGAELGALELDAAIGPDGDWCECKVPPRIWFERLAVAVDVGAFERLTMPQIVERILLPPLPGD